MNTGTERISAKRKYVVLNLAYGSVLQFLNRDAMPLKRIARRLELKLVLKRRRRDKVGRQPERGRHQTSKPPAERLANNNDLPTGSHCFGRLRKRKRIIKLSPAAGTPSENEVPVIKISQIY